MQAGEGIDFKFDFEPVESPLIITHQAEQHTFSHQKG